MLVTGLMTVAGFIGSGTPSSISSGFGHYSLNIFAPFFGTGDSYTQQLLGPVTRSMPPEGKLGFNYLGAGILFWVLLSCCSSRGKY